MIDGGAFCFYMNLLMITIQFQALQNFTVDLDDPYIGMKTGYMFEPRRPQRVTWSDDALYGHFHSLLAYFAIYL